jgi:hypothetical protein
MEVLMDTNNSAAAYEEGGVYQAKVVDQMLTRNGDGELQLVLGVRILTRLKNDRNPGDGTVGCPQQEREVWVTFVDDDEQRLHMAARDLERLGVPDDDIAKLHPDHPQFFCLVDKNVFVRMRIVNDFEFWNFAWPRERLGIDDLRQVTCRLSAELAEARQKAKKRRTKGSQAADTPGETPQPPQAGQ